MTWEAFELEFSRRYGVLASIEGALLLVGLHRLGNWPEPFDRMAKQNLIELGYRVLLEARGYARQTGSTDGWPSFELAPNAPHDLPFLKESLITFFAQIWRTLDHARATDS